MKKGFTLLEILLVIAAIGILAAIVIVAINPNRQLAQARNAERQSSVNTLSNALNQYLIDNGNYPTAVTANFTEVCNSGSNGVGEGSVNAGCSDMRVLVPDYVAAIPVNPNHDGTETGYYVWQNPENSRIAIYAESELESAIGLNNQETVSQEGLVLNIDAGKPSSYVGSGTLVSDLSSNGYDLTMANGTGYSESDSSFVFDGVNDNIYRSSNSDLEIVGDKTITFFWRLDSAGVDDTAVIARLGLATDLFYAVMANRTNQKLTYEWYDSGFQRVSSDVNVFDLDSFNQGAVVVEGSQVTFYINGQAVTQQAVTTPSPASAFSLGIGAARAGGYVGTTGQDLDGAISNLQIYNRALTDAEIVQHFDAFRGRFDL